MALPHDLGVGVAHWLVQDPIGESQTPAFFEDPKSFGQGFCGVGHVQKRLLAYHRVDAGVRQRHVHDIAF